VPQLRWAQVHEEMFLVVARKIAVRLHEFNPQELSNTLIAYAKVNIAVPGLLEVRVCVITALHS
jgi:hypothetical protein